jgi:hypothetical protein
LAPSSFSEKGLDRECCPFVPAIHVIARRPPSFGPTSSERFHCHALTRDPST